MDFREFEERYRRFDEKFGKFQIRDYGSEFKVKSVGYDIDGTTILVTPHGKILIQNILLGENRRDDIVSTFTANSMDTLKERLGQVLKKIDHYLVSGYDRAIFVVSPFPDLYLEEPEDGIPYITVPLNGRFREIIENFATIDFN